MDKLKYITRFDYANKNGYTNRGWWVRMLTGNKKYQRHKFFSDGKNRGKANALKAATAWRNKIYSALPKEAKIRAANEPNLDKYWGKGYSLVWRIGAAHKWFYAYYSVHWYEGGKQCQKEFSCSKLGFVEAERQAKAYRKKMTAHKTKRNG